MIATDGGTGVQRARRSRRREIMQEPSPATQYNRPGRNRARGRAIAAAAPTRTCRRQRGRGSSGHVVVGSIDIDASNRFFTEGIGFKISDSVKGVAHFMRCSTDHHNLLVQKAPVQFLHHTSWQVEDVDEIGLGAQALLTKDPARHVWGFGRHHIGSNFFWYFRDPAGNFSEYYATST